MPGFIDSHTHMSMGGLNLLALDLRKTKDEADFTRQVAAFAKTRPAGLWLTDGAWDHQQWAPTRFFRRARCSILRRATARPACRARTAT